MSTATVETRRGERVKVKARTVRAITYVSGGQQWETWLPAGEWQIDGDCSMAPSRATGDEWTTALILFRPVPLKHEGVWYVHPSQI